MIEDGTKTILPSVDPTDAAQEEMVTKSHCTGEMVARAQGQQLPRFPDCDHAECNPENFSK
jgi:hypothetical protein